MLTIDDLIRRLRAAGIVSQETKGTYLLPDPDNRVPERNSDMKHPMTAKEREDMLERDPKYQAMIAEQDRIGDEREAMLTADEKPLVAALAAAGRHVESIWDLVNTAESYPEALPVLAEHLSRPYQLWTREGIARALTVKEARGPIAHVVLAELKKMTEAKDFSEESFRFALTNTLTKIGDASMQEDLLQMLNDPRYAETRMGLERALKAVSRRKPPKGS